MNLRKWKQIIVLLAALGGLLFAYGFFSSGRLNRTGKYQQMYAFYPLSGWQIRI